MRDHVSPGWTHLSSIIRKTCGGLLKGGFGGRLSLGWALAIVLFLTADDNVHVVLGRGTKESSQGSWETSGTPVHKPLAVHMVRTMWPALVGNWCQRRQDVVAQQGFQHAVQGFTHVLQASPSGAA